MQDPELKRAVRDQAKLFGANQVLIEDKASGIQLIQELRQENFYQVKGRKPEGDKVNLRQPSCRGRHAYRG